MIVDDEPLARRGIRLLLEQEPDFVFTAECGSGPEAVDMIRRDPPDLVLLDIRMPEMDGFEVIEQIGVDRMPVVVFVTAFDEYAIRAFDARAVDYVLKPLDEDRFRETLDRVRSRFRTVEVGRLRDEVRALIESVRSSRLESDSGYLQRLVVREAGRVFFLQCGEIDWMETAGNYVKLHAGPRTHLIRESMANLEERIDPDMFIRIRRSAMVNIDRIVDLQQIHDGRYLFRLADGTRLESSRRYRSNLDRILSPNE